MGDTTESAAACGPPRSENWATDGHAIGKAGLSRREAMKLKLMVASCLAAGLAGLCATSGAYAKVDAAKAAELNGPKLTCMGAEKAGSKDGVAEYTGKYFGTWPGLKKPYGYDPRSEEHTSELQSLMRISYAVFCLKKKKKKKRNVNKLRKKREHN